MKLTSTSSDASVSSSTDTHTFKISANGTAFQILSSGLYSNKIAAVLRELGCNAADAHVAAGKKTTPIWVELPTENSLVLKIRDEGLGLSHEQVLSLYTTYFSSDKRDSNAYVGGLGLGSKSPFAYTNSFTVTTTQKGTMLVYTCNIGHDGAPTVTKMHEASTKKPNGVEVMLNVKRQDMYSFHSAAAEIFSRFDVTPTFNIDLQIRKPQYTMETTGYALIASGSPMAKMGNVSYPVDLRELGLSHDTDMYQFLTGTHLELRVPIGFLQVAASREALQYDPNTKSHLLQAYQQAYTDLGRKMVMVIQDKTLLNDWQKETAFTQWVKQHVPSMYSAKEVLPKCIRNSGAPKDDVEKAVAILAASFVKVPTLAGSDEDIKVYWYERAAVTRKMVEKGVITKGTRTVPATMPKHSDSCIVVVDDKHVNEKIATWRSERHAPALLLVTGGGKDSIPALKDHAQAISDELKGMPVYLLSQMPCTVVKTVAAKKAFVPVDDRTVECYDLLTKKSTTMRFGDVPVTHRYMLVRDTTASRDVNYFHALPPENTTHGDYIQTQTLQQFENMRQWLNDSKTSWHGPEGYLIVRPIDVERYKLVASGYACFVPTMLDALNTTVNADAMACLATAWPKLDKLSGYYHSSTMPTLTYGGWLSDFAYIMNQHTTGTHKKNVQSLMTILNRAGLEDLVRSRMLPSTDAQNKACAAYAHIIEQYKTKVPALSALPKGRSNAMMIEWFTQQYPLSPFTSTSLFNAFVEGKVSADALVQLKAILQVPQ